MGIKTCLCPLVVLAVAVAAARAQEVRTLDLATARPYDTVTVLQGSYVIRISDQLPRAHYLISTSSMAIYDVPPITTGAKPILPEQCPLAYTSAVRALADSGTEEDVPRLLRAAVAARPVDSTGDCVATSSELAALTARITTDSVAKYRLRAGEYVRVEVTRVAREGLAERRWQLIVTTGPRGEWQVTYGFGVPMYLGGQVRYSTRPGTSGSFVITQDSRSHYVEPVPAVFFSWMTPSGSIAPAGRLSWTAGLGADLTNPTIFLGAAWTWKRNFQVAAGLSLRQEPVLLGNYSAGDVVSTNLTFDQLTEKVYRARPFVALTLRFSKDPFGSFGWLTGTGEAKPESGKGTSGGDAASP